MPEIRLVKRYPHIKEEDVVCIFLNGYFKGLENGRKRTIPIEWLKNYEKEKGQEARLQEALSAWEKENGK